MSLTLLLQTSNGVPALALARGAEIVFDSSNRPEFDGSRDYRAMLETGLAACDSSLDTLTRIAADIGPGGLGVTRTGVAFANALGFALGLGVIAVPAFEMLGHAVADQERPTVLMRRAARPYVHFGIWQAGKLVNYEHCEQVNAFEAAQSLDKFNYVGTVLDDALPTPLFNTAPMGAMADFVAQLPDPAPDARAYPIVEVLE
ncbi:hypothetical protein [Celeribacter sp.]|uniref:hypothetical protein n=1 Tax=Celeribacter sp. TaxID=1890673 RepID=UPI003A8EAE61